MKWLHYLLAFIPVTLGLSFFGAGLPSHDLLVFVSACLAIIPLAGLMGEATDELSKHLGPNIGGLLNATFGNAAELIITCIALKAGLLEVVQASIVGSILGNLLLVLGISIVAGGWKRTSQSFNRTLAGMHSSMLLLAVTGLMVPAVFVHSLPNMAAEHAETHSPQVMTLSLWVAGVLMVSYVLGLFFSLRTHQHVFSGGEEAEVPEWSKQRSITVLAIATVFVAWMSEILVHSLEPMIHSLGLSKSAFLFVGVIVIPIIGNAAEHASAVFMAQKDKMDVALGIAIGSSTQIALFVAPLLVFISLLFGHKMSLIFTQVELVSVAFAVAIVALVSHDGETNWLEGAMLLAVYVVIALSFLLVPPPISMPAPAPAHS